MFATFLTTSLFMLLAIRGVLSTDPTITVSNLVQCQPAQITWSKTTPPYNVIVALSSNMCDTLYDLGDHNTNSIAWNVTLIAGQSVVFSVQDNAGKEDWTGSMIVGASNDVACLPANERANATAADSAAEGSSTLVVPPSTTSGAHAAGAANAGLDPLHSSARLNTPISPSALCITTLFGIVSVFL
jgi:hypothetical protein